MEVFSASMSIGSGLLFSILLLYKITDITWYVAIVIVLLKVFLMAFSRIFNFVSIIFIDCICVVAIASVLMKTSGSTCHFVLMILFISG